MNETSGAYRISTSDDNLNLLNGMSLCIVCLCCGPGCIKFFSYMHLSIISQRINIVCVIHHVTIWTTFSSDTELKFNRVTFMWYVIRKCHHHHHHFICPIIQQYAHLHEYNSRRPGQQGAIWTLTAALKRSIKTVDWLKAILMWVNL